MRFQSTWPSKDIFHEYALDFAKKVNDMTGGDLKIEVLPAGAVVPAFGLLDAVSKGVLDGGHGVLVYHYGKTDRAGAVGLGPGLRHGRQHAAGLAQVRRRQGAAREALCVDRRQRRVVPLRADADAAARLVQEADHQGVDDFKGLKYRTVGISIDVFTGMGAAVNALPGGEIVAAIDRGLLDAAEFNNASSDRVLGFADVSKVCMLQSYHQNAEQLEISFNKTKFDALPDKMKAIIANARRSLRRRTCSGRRSTATRRTTSSCRPRTRSSSTRRRTRSCKQQLEVYDEIVKKKAGDNPLFKEIVESQLAFAKRATQWEQDYVVQPQDGVRPLLRTEREEADLTARQEPAKHHSGKSPDGALSSATAFAAKRLERMNVQSDSCTRLTASAPGSARLAAWLIIGLMTVVCVEVFKRYILNTPTAWIFDVDNMLYGTLFMLCGAYTLAQNAHVRGDFLYSSMRPRMQAALDLVLYVVFFIPGIAALIYAGYDYAAQLLAHRRAFQRHGERPAGLSLQDDDPDRRRIGDAAGRSPRSCAASSASRPANGRAGCKDVAEIDVVEEQLAHSEYVDEESRKIAIERAHEIDETARQRGMGGDLNK